MISLMKNDSELDRILDVSTDYPPVFSSERTRVSVDSDFDKLTNKMGSEGARVSPVASEENKVQPRVSDGDSVDVHDSKDEARVLAEVGSGRKLDLKKEARVSGGGESSKASSSNGDAARDSDFGTAYSMVEEGAADRRIEAFGPEASIALSYGFEPGDMVWGKVKSHPWWPGHIFSEAFATHAVRRSKRAGHLLVAFFGDSSYGWFDPAELIPFAPNFAEKSRQTSLRSFVRAVEEAVDEASRRGGLGLTCKCRNDFNFRPTNVRGFFAVDVAGYEPGGVYSVMQVKKARDAFQPAEALNFVQQLALSAKSYDRRNIESIQHKARILAYRKAAYEESDQTYAEAFGIQSTKPAEDSSEKHDNKVPTKAPLSGPMVTAEALGKRKSNSKLSKVKVQKDKYLFKRRDGTDGPRSNHIAIAGTDVAAPLVHEVVVATTPVDYVLQKRTVSVSTKLEDSIEGIGTISGGAVSTLDGSHHEAESAGGHHYDFPANHATAPDIPSLGSLEDERLPLDKERVMKPNGRISTGDLGSSSIGLDGSVGMFKVSDTPPVDSQQQGARSFSEVEGHHKEGSTVPAEFHSAPSNFWDGASNEISASVATPPLHIDGQFPGTVLATVTGNSEKKKKKVQKRPLEDLNSERAFAGEKKKKTKKDLLLDNRLEHSRKRLKTAKDGEIKKSAGKSIGIGLAPPEKSQLEGPGNNDDLTSTIPTDSGLAVPKVDLGDAKIVIPELVSDLLALAIDPFHGSERKSPEIVREALVRFRSLVYQKSLVLVSPGEAEELEELFGSGSSPVIDEGPSGEDVGYFASKHSKGLIRPDDPTKAGRKRSMSGRQEEISAKRLKKVSELKTTIAEKKGGGSLKNAEMQREQRQTNTSVSTATVKSDSVKKPEPPARVSHPAVLIMKFPPRTALPSTAELKAKFARFGPLDHSALRVFWKTSTCKVVFKQMVHAQAAYNYAIQNKALFGHVNVYYNLRDLAPEVPEPMSPLFKGERRPLSMGQRTPQPTSQLKSCLKKPSGDDAGSGVPKGSPRVKFMLGGDESTTRGEQLMVSVSKDFNKNDYGGPDVVGGASSSLAMDVNSKNLQKVISPPPSVILPFPPPRNMNVNEFRGGVSHFIKPSHAPLLPLPPPVGNFIKPSHAPLPPPPPPPPPHYSAVVEPQTNYNNYNLITSANTSSNSNKNNVDISHQMLSLLVRCNDVVTDVHRLLGYAPYHPL